MWAYRELFGFLMWRDIKVRYKQTLLGVVWAVLQPLMYTLVFIVVFLRVAHAPSEGLPYPLFAFSGLVLWFFFSSAITQAGNSVIGSEALITKVYFPRIAIPFAAVGAALFDFAITFAVLIMMIIGYALFSAESTAIRITWHLVFVPVVVLLTILAALGVGAFLAALNVSYRDFKHTIPFLVQLWLFATPAIYMGVDHEMLQDPKSTSASDHSSQPMTSNANLDPLKGNQAAPRPNTDQSAGSPGDAKSVINPSMTALRSNTATEGAVPDWVQHMLKFNPMTGLVRSFRSAMLGQPMPWIHLTYSALIVATVFIGGCLYYHRVEDAFADII